MLKRKIYYFAGLLLFSLTGCNAPQKEKEVYEYPKIEINNKVLKDAIIEYQQKIFADNAKRMKKGYSVYVHVCTENINDSILRVVLIPMAHASDLKYYAPFHVLEVDGSYAFLTARSNLPAWITATPNFTLSDDDYRTLAQRYFPKEYKEENSTGLRAIMIYEPDNCYLTFINDSLIDKTYQRGLATDGVWVNINGKKVYL